MQIIGAGFGRTGTTSMKKALEMLGFGPCYHMKEVFPNPGHAIQWNAAYEGEKVDFRKTLKGYKATVDWPACDFYKELMVQFPDAKVILNTRNPDTWYKSADSTVYTISKVQPRYFGALLQRCIIGNRMDKIREMVNNGIWGKTFDGKFEDEEYAKKVFLNHIEDVKKHVPEDRLLVFNVSEGWEPLCKFLNVHVPDESFPHLNDSKEIQRFIRILKTVNLVANGVGLLCTLTTVYFLYKHFFNEKNKNFLFYFIIFYLL